jgi:DNA-binding IclR family transcriptional regulator
MRSWPSLSGGDLIVGAQAIAAPVLARDGNAAASVGLFGPAARFPPERISECVEAVKRAAVSLSRALGYRAT